MKVLLVGKDWIEVQNILKKQENMRYRMARKNKSLLSGIIKCSNCGSCLRPKLSINDNGNRFYYRCELKEKSLRKKCNIGNLNGNEVDEIVLENVKKLFSPKSEIYNQLKKIINIKDEEEEKEKSEIRRLRSEIKKNEKDIDGYLERIKDVDISLMEDITNKIKQIKEINKTLENELYQLTTNKDKICDKDTAQFVVDIIDRHFETFEDLDVLEQRDIIKLFVKDIITDGENLTINLFGSDNIDNNMLFPISENSK